VKYRILIAAVVTTAVGLAVRAEAQQATAGVSVTAPAASEPATDTAGPDLAKGRRAYQRYCSVCHGTRGEGALGPAMQGIGQRMSADELTRQLTEPRGSMPKMIPEPIDATLWADLRGYLMQLR
jgi:mono/diheme cytochrome c family protein